MSRRRASCCALALVPPLAAALTGHASGATFLLALGVDLVLALVTVRALRGVEPEGWLDDAAWVTGALALIGVTLLCCPYPPVLGYRSLPRTVLLVAGGAGATSCLALLHRPRAARGDRPRAPAQEVGTGIA